MDLEELQLAWSQMSDELENQKKLTNKIILQMTQEKYKNKFRTLSIIETFGAVVCFGAAIFILINFYKLDVWYLIAFGVYSVSFLIILPALVLKSLYTIKNINLFNKTFSEVLLRYTKEKKTLLTLQKIGAVASVIQLFAVAVIFAKILSNKNFFMVERGIGNYVIITLSLVFISIIARWGYKCYEKVTRSAENILRELE